MTNTFTKLMVAGSIVLGSMFATADVANAREAFHPGHPFLAGGYHHGFVARNEHPFGFHPFYGPRFYRGPATVRHPYLVTPFYYPNPCYNATWNPYRCNYGW